MAIDPTLMLEKTFVFAARVAVPAILAASAAGVLFSLVQAVTQIGDQTMSSGAKMAVVGLVFVLMAQGFGSELLKFTALSFLGIADVH
jgi:type III secretion protein S